MKINKWLSLLLYISRNTILLVSSGKLIVEIWCVSILLEPLIELMAILPRNY